MNKTKFSNTQTIEPQPFFILTRSRTGSNMIISQLNSHSDILAGYEIFRNQGKKSSESILNELFNSGKNKKAVGFKIFYNHPLDRKDSDIWAYLIKSTAFKVIHLKRKNILRTAVSHKISMKSGLWGVYDQQTELERKKISVEITPEELIRVITKTLSWEKEFDSKFSRHNKIEVYYENLVSNPSDEHKKIFEFLGLEIQILNSEFKKQNPEPLSELILNYYDLKNTFEGSEIEFMFED